MVVQILESRPLLREGYFGAMFQRRPLRSLLLGLVLLVTSASLGGNLRFLTPVQTGQVALGQSRQEVDRILGLDPEATYRVGKGAGRVMVRKYNLMLDHFQGGGDLQGRSSTRVVPWFVLVLENSGKVWARGTHRQILDSAAAPDTARLQALFAHVVDVDTSLCQGMGVDRLVEHLERNLGWQRPLWSNRLEEFNVRKALALLADSLQVAPPTADNFRRRGSLHRARAVLGLEAGFDSASGDFARSLQLDSTQWRSAFLRGQILLLTGSPDSARGAYDLFARLRARGPGEMKSRALWGMAVARWRTGQDSQAYAFLEQYLRIHPADKGALLLRQKLGSPADCPELPKG